MGKLKSPSFQAVTSPSSNASSALSSSLKNTPLSPHHSPPSPALRAIVQTSPEFSGPASSKKKMLDLNGVINRTLQLQDHSPRRNNVEVEFQAIPGLPPIVGDANQLIQIFLNLISNAEQAIREVRPSGRIQIRLARSGNRASATVQDDATALRPEVLPKLF